MSDLVDEVVTDILSRLNVVDRIQNCALVDGRLRRLATHPGANIILRPHRSLDRTAARHFQEWLVQHGQQATEIDVSSSCAWGKAIWTQPLPCPQLRSLQLRACTVQLATLLQDCAELTLLSLQDCSVVDTAQELEAMPALSSLRHFDFEVPTGESYIIPGCLLSQKPQLTHLRLAGCIDGSTLHQLSACRELRELLLDFHNEGPHGSAQVLEPVRLLSTSLTKLSVASTDCYNGFQVPEGHAISRLTALQCLELTGGDWLHPAVLQPLTALTALSVEYTPLESLPRPGSVAAAAQLLALLPQLQRLRQMSLWDSLEATAQLQLAAPAQVELQAQQPPAPADDMDTDDESDADGSQDGADVEQPAAVEPPAPEVFAALTFPTLELLDVADCSLPPEAPAHMFRAGLQMPQLRVLRLAGEEKGMLLTQGQLDRLAACSPNLQELAIGGSNGPVLANLPRTVTKLHICSTSNSIGYLVAALTQLQSLSVVKCSFADRAMLALTALTRLTKLRVESGSFSESFQGCCLKPAAEGWNYLYHRAAEDRLCADLPVWARLLQDCMSSRVCQADIVRTIMSLQQQVAADQAHISRLQQQVQQLNADWDAESESVEQQLIVALLRRGELTEEDDGSLAWV